MDITITAYGEQCWICDLQIIRFSFGSRARLDQSELLCGRVLLGEKGQRKLLTQTSERGQRAPPSLLLSRPYVLLPDPPPQCTS